MQTRASAVPGGWRSRRDERQASLTSSGSPESLPSGRALPAKQRARSSKGLKHRESSSHQTLHLLHLKKLLSQPPSRASALHQSPATRCSHAVPTTPQEKWKTERLRAAPNDQVYEELIEFKDMRQQLVL